MSVTAVVAENPIALLQVIHDGQSAQFLADAGVDSPREPALGEQTQQPLLEVPDNGRSLEKRIIHWRCNWLISRCQRLSLAVGAPVLEDEKNFRFSQVRSAAKAFGELPPGGSLQVRPELGSASGYG